MQRSVCGELKTYYRYDIGCHVGEAHAAGVERAHQQLSVLIGVFVFAHVVRLDHLFLQNNHQLRRRRASFNSQQVDGGRPQK